jgi:hypothetical protein
MTDTNGGFDTSKPGDQGTSGSGVCTPDDGGKKSAPEPKPAAPATPSN